MEILKSAAILVIGFVLLIKGADFFVEGSSSVAKKFNVPSLIIGMTIVAMGTSLPELAVSVTAAITGNNTLAVSNVSGSNIFNLMVVCGACALFAPLTIEKNTLMKEFPFSIVCAGLLVVLGFVAGVAYMLQMPLFILIVGLIYLVEVLSVMIQVTYFKATHGKRIFKMAPIHHHFELCGWSEARVVAVFTIVTAIMCLIGLLAL